MSQPDVKPRMYPTIPVTARIIYAKEGFTGFYRGFVPCIMRSFPTNGAALWVYTWIMAAVAGRREVNGDVVHLVVDE
jgi:solute carrier family 25 carnitine/acylcarnitine transporter 20/29